MFFKKKIVKRNVNVGKATLQITFMDNSSEIRDFYGHQDNRIITGFVSGLMLAKQYMHEVPRHDYRVTSNHGLEVMFKDIRSMKIISTEQYIIELR